MDDPIKHPAKYTDIILPLFTDILFKNKCRSVLDPFAGTGKIALVKKYGFSGTVAANEIEPEWLSPNKYGCDLLFFEDAEFCNFGEKQFDAICTSPTYGNRMADHHNAKDGSRRITYTHYLGHKLTDGNTGSMQFGDAYKRKHFFTYRNILDHLAPGGIFILNISDHVRKGLIVPVTDWHSATLSNLGMSLIKTYHVKTPRHRYGANRNARVPYESVLVFQK